MMYAVQGLAQYVEVSAFGIHHEVKLSFADGMIGALPVFDTYENAKAYAGDRFKIAPIASSEEEVSEQR